MLVSESYNIWCETYDEVQNKTRDLESIIQKEILDYHEFNSILELGCGTGKNTKWLISKCQSLLAVDISEGMIKKAASGINDPKVQFIQANIDEEWTFSHPPYNLISCSLVLEHIRDISSVFQKASQNLSKGGFFYIAELHPFKQYLGSTARFEINSRETQVQSFTHHVSDYISSALSNNFSLTKLKEGFDENVAIPRILAMLFVKK